MVEYGKQYDLDLHLEVLAIIYNMNMENNMTLTFI